MKQYFSGASRQTAQAYLFGFVDTNSVCSSCSSSESNVFSSCSGSELRVSSSCSGGE